MSIVKELSCSHCGAPISFKPGEIIATCRYCGYTVVIETGEVSTFEHSMLLNKYDARQIEELVKEWMRSGFLETSRTCPKSENHRKNLDLPTFLDLIREC